MNNQVNENVDQVNEKGEENKMKFVKPEIKEIVGMGKDVEDVFYDEFDGEGNLIENEKDVVVKSLNIDGGIILTDDPTWFGSESEKSVKESEVKIGLLFFGDLWDKLDCGEEITYDFVSVDRAKEIVDKLNKAIYLAEHFKFEDLFVERKER